jgi:serine/threonine protein phosphatase 1
MRIFVMSDIHGNAELFNRALKQVKLEKSDKLILLGDLIDRGNNSKAVLDSIFLLKENGFDVECLLGNHEKMFLDAAENDDSLYSWLTNGGNMTLTSFMTSKIERIPSVYIDFIRTFKFFYEFKNFIFVHAAINMNLENPYSDIQTLLWERNPQKYFNSNWLGNRIVIHGHHPDIKNSIINKIVLKEKIIGIDNGIYLKRNGFGSLCILELESWRVNFIE